VLFVEDASSWSSGFNRRQPVSALLTIPSCDAYEQAADQQRQIRPTGRFPSTRTAATTDS
jgi:hypothetical protein